MAQIEQDAAKAATMVGMLQRATGLRATSTDTAAAAAAATAGQTASAADVHQQSLPAASRSIIKCSCTAACAASGVDPLHVIITSPADSLSAFHERVATNAPTDARSVVQVPIDGQCELAEALLLLMGLDATQGSWQIIAVARVKPHDDNKKLLAMARCVQRAAEADHARCAIDSPSLAAFTTITQQTLVVQIPRECRHTDQLQLEQALVAVRPTSAAGKSVIEVNAATFTTRQQEKFTEGTTIGKVDKMLRHQHAKGPRAPAKVDSGTSWLEEMQKQCATMTGNAWMSSAVPACVMHVTFAFTLL